MTNKTENLKGRKIVKELALLGQELQAKQKKLEHFSFSSIKIWKGCPFAFKLQYIDKVPGFEGNEHTAFGQAMHFVCETVLQQEKPGTIDEAKLFLDKFKEEICALPKKVRDKLKEKSIKDMEEQGKTLAPLAIPFLKKKFPGFILVGVEEYLYEPIDEYELHDYSFKGYVDLIIKTVDGKYHVIDWKTCSWGWDAKKRSDPLVTYQLTLYKHFLCKKLGIDPKDMETHCALLKRTATKDRVEIFRVTSGPRKTRNALKLLEECVYNVDHNRHIKNRLSCGSCDFHRTKYCP